MFNSKHNKNYGNLKNATFMELWEEFNNTGPEMNLEVWPKNNRGNLREDSSLVLILSWQNKNKEYILFLLIFVRCSWTIYGYYSVISRDFS